MGIQEDEAARKTIQFHRNADAEKLARTFTGTAVVAYVQNQLRKISPFNSQSVQFDDAKEMISVECRGSDLRAPRIGMQEMDLDNNKSDSPESSLLYEIPLNEAVKKLVSYDEKKRLDGFGKDAIELLSKPAKEAVEQAAHDAAVKAVTGKSPEKAAQVGG